MVMFISLPRLRLGPGTYYFEFLEKAFDGKCVATVKVSLSFILAEWCKVLCFQWKQPGDTDFKTISSDHFAMAVKCESH